MQLELGMYRTTKGFKANHKSTELICENCESKFLANRKNARFCSSSCRSQFWLNKNSKKVITLAVPADIDEEYLEYVKGLLLNYKKKGSAPIEAPKASPQVEQNEKQAQIHTINETRVFENIQELRSYLERSGFDDFKIPKIDNGIYYDEGLTIKKIGDEYETHIHQKNAS